MKVPQPWGDDGAGPEGSAPMRGAGVHSFQVALLHWYRPRARPLRIRATLDPWAILVAEVMAQQTQIARVDEAWVGFMERYPTPRDLADASTAEVVRAWAGLGYNRRAVNLQRAARAIEADHGGRVPDDIDALEALPGIGPYTARALASTAFGEAVAAVDTNVRRVVSRVHGGSMTAAQLQDAADALVPPDDTATWTHASMDLGATVCRSRRPLCDECPVSDWCASAGKVVDPPRSTAARLPFEATSRWLRGHIVQRLREADDAAWTRLPSVLGPHEEAAIEAAVAGLLRDGVVERRPDGAVRLPSGQI